MQGFVLWVPMLAADDAAAAERQAASWRDDRVDHWWDGSGRLGQVFQRALGLHGPAWDVYLLYPRGVRWEGELPPRPHFWMHQLSDQGADPALLLGREPERLGRELAALREE